MSFYIGQPVRVVSALAFPELIGKETVITGHCSVCQNCYETTLRYNGFPLHGRSHNFEPVIPPGLESPAEIAALYEPEDAIA